ncbi:MAG: hypothetical protein ABIK09_02630 [Pseudomonadota bacterium]
MKTSQRITLALLFTVLCSDGCIRSRCYRDRDCPGGQVCNSATGVCVVPDCIGDDACLAGQICQANVCVPGCLGDEDCGTAKVCVAGHCVLETSSGSGCICIAAPLFCAQDIHPGSTTFQSEICMGDTSQTAKLLFFGNTG